MPDYPDFLTVDERYGALERLKEEYSDLCEFIAAQGIPLHLGEPEAPYGKKLDSRAMFENKAAEVEANLDHTVVPIEKLASVQLLTAVHATDYVQHDAEMAGWKKSKEPAQDLEGDA